MITSILCGSLFSQAQNVGIGTNTPTARLHIEVPSGFTSPVLQVNQQGSATPYIIIQPDGKVGIGVATPSEVLDVSGNIQFSGALMPGGNAGSAGFVLMSQGAGNSPVWVDTALLGDKWGGQVAQTQGPLVGDGTSTNPIGLQSGTNAGDVLIWNGSQWTIKPSPFDSVCNSATKNFVQKWTGSSLCNTSIYDSAGFVGINTTNPQATLEINGNLSFSGAAPNVYGTPKVYAKDSGVLYPMIMLERSNRDMPILYARTASPVTTGHVPRIELFRADGTLSNPQPTLATQWLGAITVGGFDTSWTTAGVGGGCESGIIFTSGGQWSPTSHPTEIYFKTIDTGSTCGKVRLFINEDGKIGINTTTFNSNCVACPLQVNGRMMLRSFDAVYMSGWDGVPQNYHLIGTYMGWDREAIYIGGYNYYFPAGGDTLGSYAKRLRIGSGLSPSTNVVVDFQNGNMGLGTATPTEKLHVVGNIRSRSAFTVNVNGCGSNVCTYTVNFPVPFSTPPVVNITTGPNANPSWGPLIPLIGNVTTTSVTFYLDSGNGSQAITGTKTIHIIAIAP